MRNYLLQLLAITVAVIYAPTARRWFISAGYSENGAGNASIWVGLVVSVAGVWLLIQGWEIMVATGAERRRTFKRDADAQRKADADRVAAKVAAAIRASAEKFSHIEETYDLDRTNFEEKREWRRRHGSTISDEDWLK